MTSTETGVLMFLDVAMSTNKAVLEAVTRRAQLLQQYTRKYPQTTTIAVAASVVGLGAMALHRYMDEWSWLSMWEDEGAEETVRRTSSSPEIITTHTLSPTIEDIPAAVESLRKVYNSGRTLSLAKRGQELRALRRLLEDNESEICDALVEDLGRPRAESVYYDVELPKASINKLIKNLRRWTAPEKVRSLSLATFPSSQWIVKEPYGVALVIGTWNYPFLLSLVPLAGAIAAGNTVLLKPCNMSKASAKLQAKLVRKYMDPHVVTVVGPEIEGDRTTTTALLEQKFDVAFFTGSPTVGRLVAAKCGSQLTPCTLELGGKNPVIIAPDANIPNAAKMVMWGRLMNSGQQCISPDYVLCSAAVADEFLSECSACVARMYPKPDEPGAFGRIVGDAQMARLEGLLETHGGMVVSGGGVNRASKYVAPTIVKVFLDSPLMQEEIFGPILPVCVVPNVNTAVEVVKRRPKPLSLYLFSSSRQTQMKVLKETSAGGVTINGTLFHAAHSDLPFGGVGESGFGAYHGRYTIDSFQHEKPCLVKGGWMGLPWFASPPWTPSKLSLMRWVGANS